MVKLFEEGAKLQRFLEVNNVPFCFIGALTVLRWGSVRTTHYLDITVLCGFGIKKRLPKLTALI